MRIPEKEVAPIRNRLSRARGQLDAVIRMLDDGEECEDVVTQLSAASRAIDRAGFAMIAVGMRQCLLQENQAPELEKLEKLFLSLS